MAFTAGFTEGLAEGEDSGVGVGVGVGVGEGEGLAVSPKTCGDGKKVFFKKIPEPIKIRSSKPERKTVGLEGLFAKSLSNIIALYIN